MPKRAVSRTGTAPGTGGAPPELPGAGESPASAGFAPSSCPARADQAGQRADGGMPVRQNAPQPELFSRPTAQTSVQPPEEELQRLRAELAVLRHRLRKAEARLLPLDADPETPDMLLDAVPVLALCIDADGRVRMVNRGFESLFGVWRMEARGHRLEGLVPPEVSAQLSPLLARAFAGEQRVTGELAVSGHAGDRWFNITLAGRGLPGSGIMCRVLLVGVEITEAVTARRALREVGETRRALLDAAPGAAFLMEPDGTIVAHNSAAARHAWRDGQDMVGESVFALMPPGMTARRREELARCVATGRGGYFEEHDGGRVLRHNLAPVFDVQGRVAQIAVYLHDVTSQRRAEEELQATLERKDRMVHAHEAALGRHERLLRRIYDDVPVGLLHTSAAGNVIEANRALCAITGLTLSEMRGMHVLDLVLPEYRESLAYEMRRNRAERDRVARFEVRVRRPDDEIRLCRVTSTVIWGTDDLPLFGLGVVEDQTELHRLRAEAVRAGQLAALGELAAGVAHEINNPINGIINCAQLLLDDADVSAQGGMRHEPQPELAGRILREGQRIAGIVRNLLFFGRDRRDTDVRVDLREVLHDTLALTRTLMEGDGVVIELNLPDLPLMVVGRPGELQQVFMNLLANAHHALNAAETGGQGEPGAVPRPRRLTLTAARSSLGPQREAARKGVSLDGGGDGCRGICIPERRAARRRGGRLTVSGPCVCVTVADTGTGIAPAVLDRVFEPFFTTKPEGKGTGLGLSISYGIVKSHGGTLVLDSDGVSGSRAVVVLPEAPPESLLEADAGAPTAPDTPDTHVSGRQGEVAHGEDIAR
ncbi:PAS domain-containing protein [Desulfovibrio sp. DS-1]|uniref:PAS domain-containing sensor histidine kinase n=1 Tax=Nitratidesulfovibrio sp. SRB-5 TaxID=2872636 RepID=UPI00102565A5|nr:PAS domain-containing protein [Nitratidesulfovibrio sp. SRB-5]RXF77863.1 PAS domain S-box protein [Desulfovibrio sp. DS-1]